MKVKWKSLSHVLLFATSVAWNSLDQNTGVGKSFSSPGDHSNPGIEPRSPALQADSLPAEPQGKPKTYVMYKIISWTHVWNQLFIHYYPLLPLK